MDVSVKCIACTSISLSMSSILKKMFLTYKIVLQNKHLVFVLLKLPFEHRCSKTGWHLSHEFACKNFCILGIRSHKPILCVCVCVCNWACEPSAHSIVVCVEAFYFFLGGEWRESVCSWGLVGFPDCNTNTTSRATTIWAPWIHPGCLDEKKGTSDECKHSQNKLRCLLLCSDARCLCVQVQDQLSGWLLFYVFILFWSPAVGNMAPLHLSLLFKADLFY